MAAPPMPAAALAPALDSAERVYRVQRQQHLVFDIDGTLLLSFTTAPGHADSVAAAAADGDDTEAAELVEARRLTGRAPDLVERDFVSFLRPGAVRTLRAAFDRYATVSLWSAGARPYVDAVARRLEAMTAGHGAFAHVWALEQCDSVRGSVPPARAHLDNGIRKRLAKLWRFDARMTPMNTLMIEDTPTNGADNPFNLVVVPRYDLDAMADGDDRGGAPMDALWLELESRAVADVRDAPSSRRTAEALARDVGASLRAWRAGFETTTPTPTSDEREEMGSV